MTLPPSDHFNGKTFFNPGEGPAPGLADLLKWKLTGHPTPWPREVHFVRRPLPPAPGGPGVVATWIGQSSFLLQTSSATVLTDPVFSDRASPVRWMGPRRVAPPGLDFDALPRVDLVLLSHDHYDHCDVPTLRRLARRDDPLVVAPLGHRSLLARAGLRRIVELDWWETHRGEDGLRATLVPARHWSNRRPFGRNLRLWGGFMLQSGERRIYFLGDSGYEEGLFARIRERCGAPDLALVPIGAYEPRWFMRTMHMNPAEAVQAHREVGARRSLPMHWGTFDLTDEGREEPVRALEAARASAGLKADEFGALAIGESAFG